MTTKIFRPRVLLCAMALLFLASCKDDPASSDETSASEAAADGFGTIIGIETGGAGSTVTDGANLSEGLYIAPFMKDGGSKILERDSLFDPITNKHTIILTRDRSTANAEFSSRLIFNYTLYTGGASTPGFTQGSTDSIAMSVDGRHTVTTARINSEDTSHSEWTLTEFAAFDGTPPVLNGAYWRSGVHTLTTAMGGRQVDVTQNVTFNNNQIIRNPDDGLLYLTGTATSDYTATGSNGLSIQRHIEATFNGDGTATLAITRANSQGQVDSCEIDVRTGRFRRWLNR